MEALYTLWYSYGKIFGGVSFIPLWLTSLGHLLALIYEMEIGHSQRRFTYKYDCKMRIV